MKRIILTLGILLSSVLGCGLLTDVCITIGINFTSVKYYSQYPEDYETGYLETDTLRNQLFFKIEGEYDCETWGKRTFSLNNNCYNSCYATSKAVVIKNPIDNSTFNLSLNKQINYEGVEILPKTDLFDIDNISKEIFIKELDTRYYPVQIIKFSDKFYQNVKLDQDDYTFYFSCKTDDNKQFTDSLQVYIGL